MQLKSNLFKRYLLILIGFFIVLLLPIVFTRPFTQHVLIMVFVWATLGVGWNMLSGYAGQVSLGHAMYFGIGGYSATLLLLKMGIVPWIGMIVGAIIAAGISYALGYPLFRLQGFYFAIATIALGEIALISFTNWSWAGGAKGLFVPIHGNSLLYLQFTSKTPYFYTIFALFIISMIGASILVNGKAGYYFRAVKDEPDAAMSLGVNIRKYKTIAYMFSAIIAAIAGVFYANYLLYIDPNSLFFSRISVQIALVTILGGIGNLWGPLIGATALIPLAEFARVQFGGAGRAIDLVIYGVLIITFAIFQPYGLIGLYKSFMMKYREIKNTKNSFGSYLIILISKYLPANRKE